MGELQHGRGGGVGGGVGRSDVFVFGIAWVSHGYWSRMVIRYRSIFKGIAAFGGAVDLS